VIAESSALDAMVVRLCCGNLSACCVSLHPLLPARANACKMIVEFHCLKAQYKICSSASKPAIFVLQASGQSAQPCTFT
jgi:hypothetical protein